jgi:hypothetical protein
MAVINEEEMCRMAGCVLAKRSLQTGIPESVMVGASASASLQFSFVNQTDTTMNVT